MEYVYASLLINKAGGQVNETTLTKVLSAAGAKVDEARIRAIVAALEGVDIQEAIKNAAAASAPVAAPAAGAAPKKEEAKKEEKNEEAAAEGLGSLFG